jgi:hypothetical protein
MEQMKKPKSGEPSLRERLSQRLLQALEADFEVHGVSVLERMRESSPERYCQLSAKLIMSAEPKQNPQGLAAATNSNEMGRIYLQQVGLLEPTDQQIEQAVAAVDELLARLEAIKNAAAFGTLDNGNRELGELN